MIGCGDKRNGSVKRGMMEECICIERGGGREGGVLGERGGGSVGRERGGGEGGVLGERGGGSVGREGGVLGERGGGSVGREGRGECLYVLFLSLCIFID